MFLCDVKYIEYRYVHTNISV